jgi:HK97 family phage major capsid protein
MRPHFLTARDPQGNQIFQAALNLTDPFDTIAGLRVEYGKAVAGRIGTSADTGVRMFAGDFSQIVYGYADQITLKRTDVGTIGKDGEQINLWQTNQVAYLVEVTFGWLVNDPSAFVAYEMAPPPHVAAAA